MAYRILSHTADTGIEATADSLAGLIEELLMATFRLIADLSEIHPGPPITVEVESHTLEDLVVDTLSELLFRSETEDLVFCRFSVSAQSRPPSASITAWSAPLDRGRVEGAAIKAVTYHRLAVEETDGEWFARVYLDV